MFCLNLTVNVLFWQLYDDLNFIQNSEILIEWYPQE